MRQVAAIVDGMGPQISAEYRFEMEHDGVHLFGKFDDGDEEIDLGLAKDVADAMAKHFTEINKSGKRKTKFGVLGSYIRAHLLPFMGDSNIPQKTLCVLAGRNGTALSQGVVAGIFGMYSCKANSQSVTDMFRVAFLVQALRSAEDEAFALDLETLKKALAIDDDDAVVSAQRKPASTTRQPKFVLGTDIHNKALNSRYKAKFAQVKKKMLLKRKREPNSDAKPKVQM